MKLKEIELTYMGISFTLEDLKKYRKDTKNVELHKSGGLMYFNIKLKDYENINYKEFDEIAQNIINLDSIKSMCVLFTLKRLGNKIPDLFNKIIESEDEDEAFDLFRELVTKK